MSERELRVDQSDAETAQQAPIADEELATTASFRSAGAVPAVSGEQEPVASASSRAYADHDVSAHAASHHGIPGGARNVSMVHINQHGAKVNGHKQYTRVTVRGHQPELGKGARVFKNDGQAIGDIAAGTHIDVNAGQICHLKVEGHEHPVECVLGHGSPPGWMPVSAFEHHGELAHRQRDMAHKIAHQQHNNPHQEGIARTMRNRPIPADLDKLFTKPHQQADTANHAHDYFVRGPGRANLLLNIPTWTSAGHAVGERLGSASDIVQTAELGAEPNEHQVFHQTGGHAQVPLFEHGKATQVNHITFVYGFVINSAGERRYGWMNEFLLD